MLDKTASSLAVTKEQMDRLSLASKSDKTIAIIPEEEVGKPSTRPTTKGNLTWHYRMNNTRDVAFAAGKGMIWDAAKINLPSRRKALAMSCYPVESVGDSAWSRSTEYLKSSIEIYSEHFLLPSLTYGLQKNHLSIEVSYVEKEEEI